MPLTVTVGPWHTMVFILFFWCVHSVFSEFFFEYCFSNLDENMIKKVFLEKWQFMPGATCYEKDTADALQNIEGLRDFVE